METNCSVTVLLVSNGRVGFLKRASDDTFSGMLVAPGGRIEIDDMLDVIDGVNYYSVEKACIRELEEEAGLRLEPEQLRYFCSLTLPNGRVVISLYAIIPREEGSLLYLSRQQIENRIDFAPGMKTEALMLLDFIKHKKKWG